MSLIIKMLLGFLLFYDDYHLSFLKSLNKNPILINHHQKNKNKKQEICKSKEQNK